MANILDWRIPETFTATKENLGSFVAELQGKYDEAKKFIGGFFPTSVRDTGEVNPEVPRLGMGAQPNQPAPVNTQESAYAGILPERWKKTKEFLGAPGGGAAVETEAGVKTTDSMLGLYPEKRVPFESGTTREKPAGVSGEFTSAPAPVTAPVPAVAGAGVPPVAPVTINKNLPLEKMEPGTGWIERPTQWEGPGAGILNNPKSTMRERMPAYENTELKAGTTLGIMKPTPTTPLTPEQAARQDMIAHTDQIDKLIEDIRANPGSRSPTGGFNKNATAAIEHLVTAKTTYLGHGELTKLSLAEKEAQRLDRKAIADMALGEKKAVDFQKMLDVTAPIHATQVDTEGKRTKVYDVAILDLMDRKVSPQNMPGHYAGWGKSLWETREEGVTTDFANMGIKYVAGDINKQGTQTYRIRQALLKADRDKRLGIIAKKG